MNRFIDFPFKGTPPQPKPDGADISRLGGNKGESGDIAKLKVKRFFPKPKQDIQPDRRKAEIIPFPS